MCYDSSGLITQGQENSLAQSRAGTDDGDMTSTQE